MRRIVIRTSGQISKKMNRKKSIVLFFEKNSLTLVFLNPIQNGVAVKIVQLRGTTVILNMYVEYLKPVCSKKYYIKINGQWLMKT